MPAHRSAHSGDRNMPSPSHAVNMASQSASFDQRTRSEESWVEISSQPSSSSLSSIGEDNIVTTGLRVQHDPRSRRRRSLRRDRLSHLAVSGHPMGAGGTSSQEEYEESESESDRVLTSSGEHPLVEDAGTYSHQAVLQPPSSAPVEVNIQQRQVSDDDDDENRTAINYPIHNDQVFTPHPNAFSHPPSSQLRHTSQPVPGSYFPDQRRQAPRPATRHSFSSQRNGNSHMPQNILSPSYNAAAQHDEALRNSLSTLHSLARAARGASSPDSKRQTTSAPQQPRSRGVEPLSLRLVPESELPTAVTSPPLLQEPIFEPTIRRESISTSTSSERFKENKRKAGRTSSRERRSLKKARRTTAPSEEVYISPTLLTWVVSAGVVVFLSALSFSAGYSLGKEAGRLEAGSFGTDEQLRSCAREAGRSSMGLKRSLARSAVQV